MLSADHKEDTEGGGFDYQGEGLKIVDALLLAETLCNKMSLILSYFTIQASLLL